MYGSLSTCSSVQPTHLASAQLPHLSSFSHPIQRPCAGSSLFSSYWTLQTRQCNWIILATLLDFFLRFIGRLVDLWLRDSVAVLVPSATIVGPANDGYFGIIRNGLNCHWKRCGELGRLIKTYYLRDKFRAKVIIKILKMLGESSTSANRWRQ